MRPAFLALALAASCGGGGKQERSRAAPDAAPDVAEPDAGPDAAPDVAPDASLPDTFFGPSFVGVAENVDGTTPDDIALGYFWDEARVRIPHATGECVGFLTTDGVPAGRDVGAVTVEGGAVADPATLAHDPGTGSYYLGDPTDAWNPGDSLTLVADGRRLGPLEVPTEFASENLSTRTTVNRDGPLPLVFSGTNATSVALSLGGSGGAERYLLICIAPSAPGQYAVPAEAMGSIPASITSAVIKLSPVNHTDDGEVAFFVAGQAAEVTATIGP